MECLSILPEEIIEKIVGYLDEPALVACLSTCQCLRTLANQNKFWVLPCRRINLNIHDIPPKSSFSYFDLCALAQEWFDAKRRAWKWRTEEIGSVNIPNDFLCCYRHRIMHFNPKKKYIEISIISENGLSSFYRIKFTPNLHPKFELINGNMNSTYCSISTPTFVVVYKGYHTLNFHLALGILGDTVIDISGVLKKYTLKEDNNTFYFDPISNFGDILFVGLTKYSLELGPIYIVNLKTKNILRLSLTPGYKYEPVCEKYLPCFSDKDVIIFNMEGKEIFRKSGCHKLYFNENFVAFYENSRMHLYELATKQIIRSFNLLANPNFTMHFKLDYYYYFNKQNSTLYAHEIRSDLKLWEKRMTFEVSNPTDITLCVEGGYVWANFHAAEFYYNSNNRNGDALDIFCKYTDTGETVGFYVVESRTGRLVERPECYDYVKPQLMKFFREDTGEGFLCYFVY